MRADVYLKRALRMPDPARPSAALSYALARPLSPSRMRLLACVLLACGALAGCGGDDDGGDGETPPSVAQPEDFPEATGRSIQGLRTQMGQTGPVLVPAVSHLVVGENRFGFGLFDRARNQIADAEVAVYVGPTGGGKAEGPFPARFEKLDVKPQFQSRTVAADEDAVQSLYVADVKIDRPGDYEVLAIAKLDDRLVAATTTGSVLRVGERDPVPAVGERAPVIHTPTEASAGGDLDSIDTREPPSSMHEADFADVVGKKPVVLLFATPQLCESRVCGPVVDVAEEVKSAYGDEVEFIHMEIYRDNLVERGFRSQVVAYRLPTEPWVFAIDRNGRIVARIEGAFSVDELKEAVKRALAG
jgi:hypothetical protein